MATEEERLPLETAGVQETLETGGCIEGCRRTVTAMIKS